MARWTYAAVTISAVMISAVMTMALLTTGANAYPHTERPSETDETESTAIREKLQGLATEFYEAVIHERQKDKCIAIAEEMHLLGVESSNRLLKVPGLIRLAYCEIRFGSWGKQWNKKLKECERLCDKDVWSREHAETLLFRGHMARWRHKRSLSEGVADIKRAIFIASRIEDDRLVAEAHHRIAELFLLEGRTFACRSHALHALKIAEHYGYHAAKVRALHIILSSLESDNQTRMALPYARRQLEISPENRLANAIVSRVAMARENIDEQRKKMEAFPGTGLSIKQSLDLADLCASLGKNYAELGEPQQAVDCYIKSAQLFKSSDNASEDNATEYVDKLLRGYTCCVDSNLEFPVVEPFFEMLERPDATYLPSELRQIVRILEKIDRKTLADRPLEIGEWRKKIQPAFQATTQTDLLRAETEATLRFDLELARRDLQAKLQKKLKQEQANVLNEQLAARRSQVAFGSAFLIFGFLSLMFYTVTNRKSFRKLKVEVAVREAAQAKSEELAQQLLQTQKLDALGTLTAGIAHDFNNTLQAVMMLTEVVKDGDDGTSPDSKYLDSILEVAQQGSTLMRGMLVFSGKHETLKSTGDIIALARETESMVRHMVPASIAICSEIVSRSQTIPVEINESQIKQVLLNLVINARDAMPEGGHLLIQIAEHEKQPDFVRLTVTDDGGGMTDEVRTRVFEPFFTTKDRGRGTGLGMSMVRGIVEDHGGTIEIESELDKGTTINILLPRTLQEDDSVDQPVEHHFKANGELVLLAEDNEHIRFAIKTKLERLGFEVHEAEDGDSIQQIYANLPGELRLMLIDIDLPGMDGRRCVEALRKSGTTAPVIFMTGLSSNQSDDAVLSKPFKDEELLNAIAEVFQSGNTVSADPNDER